MRAYLNSYGLELAQVQQSNLSLHAAHEQHLKACHSHTHTSCSDVAATQPTAMRSGGTFLMSNTVMSSKLCDRLSPNDKPGSSKLVSTESLICGQ